jgi:hypothetical protein
MQIEIYAYPGANETHEKKVFRLSFKWLIESELWMVTIIIFELTAVYFLSRMGDKKHSVVKELKDLGYDDKRLNEIENNY